MGVARKSIFVWFILSIFFAYLAANDLPKREEKKSKSVTTFLSAKWEATPLLLELAEYLAGESSDLFWSFLQDVNKLKTPIDDLETDKDRYDAAIVVAANLLAPSQLRLLKLALATHVTSPAVRMFSEIAGRSGAADAGCDTFVQVAGKLLCRDDDVESVLRAADQYDVVEYRIDTYSLDHRYPNCDNRSLTAVLYGELGTADFSTKHNILAGYADKGIIDYVVRWNVRPRGKPLIRLSGYGVELQLKSTEYKSQDDAPAPGDQAATGSEGSAEEEDENDPQNQVEGFNFGKLKNLFPALRSPLERFRRHLSEASEELAPLKVWQMQALSMQAAAAVLDAADAGGDEPLRVLTGIAQNFPMQTKSLVHVSVPRALREEVLHNQEIWSGARGSSDTLLMVAGAQHDAEEADIMSLLTALREDVGPMTALYAMGLPNKLITALLSLDLADGASSDEHALDIRHTAVTWLNDIETDERYRRWPASYMELLRPMYPGMLRNLRRNIYNFIVVIDPTSAQSRAALQLSDTLLRHGTPVRVGLVLTAAAAGSEAVGDAARSAFNYVAQASDSNKDAFTFLEKMLSSMKGSVLTMEELKKQLGTVVKSGVSVDDVISEDSEYNFGKQLSAEFVAKIGSSKFPEALVNGVPLSEASDPGMLQSADLLEEALVTALSRHTARVQRAVFRGELKDPDDAVEFIMNQPHVLPRLNNRILTAEPSQYLDVSGTPAPRQVFAPDQLPALLSLSPRDAVASALHLVRYFLKPSKSGATEKITQTVWVVGDLKDKGTRNLLKAGLDYMRGTFGVRVAFIPNTEGGGESQSLNKVVLAALAVLKPAEATEYVGALLADEGCHLKKSCNILPELVPALNKYEWVLKPARVLCVRALHLKKPGARAVLHNGRLLGPLEDEEVFDEEDFGLLERFANQAYGDKIAEILTPKSRATKTNEITDDDDDDDTETMPEITADFLLKITSVLASRPARTRSQLPAGLQTEHSVVTLPPLYSQEPAADVVVVLDPASTAAQRLGPLLLVLRKVLNCNIRLFLNPIDKNSDMPLKSFYRYVLEPEPTFTRTGASSPGPMARFPRLPHAPLLSLQLRTPTNWLVECVRSVYDLDNIRLADVDNVVHSEFELEYLLVEGHAWDAMSGTPPRGLQLTLGTATQPDLMDTIVMANLGYFQLKANPGAWILRLRPGRSADIYDIVGHENTDTPTGSTDIQVLVSSFRSHVLKLRVAKKEGKQGIDLLAEDNEAQGGIWNSIASSFGGGELEPDAVDETINIFSVASGHLYERFLRIMMMSVLKHTKSPVKFWFLKNYLSPSLIDILPYMSKEYGFEYSLVQYQWPRWLQRQRDRQRTIWGYKILFLDVLFPLQLKKIIFVDADQIVRADLKELVNLDLGGAPYGYTPFCDSRKEMEGFRFWKQGYWRNHLQGRRYHISALYVVDLKRFRRIAAGDRLRGQYQALSQDPNSLSNLDQDLPNNMIHQVGIKSLPQEWLWCETWCDEPSKPYAKTIDLCNNPMTKEAKLSAAMRIVPEWSEYDLEIKNLQAKVRRGLYQGGDQEQEPEQVYHSHDADVKPSSAAETVHKSEEVHTEL